jgi:hypothetical protein
MNVSMNFLINWMLISHCCCCCFYTTCTLLYLKKCCVQGADRAVSANCKPIATLLLLLLLYCCISQWHEELLLHPRGGHPEHSCLEIHLWPELGELRAVLLD